jgi:hypothetical protein
MAQRGGRGGPTPILPPDPQGGEGRRRVVSAEVADRSALRQNTVEGSEAERARRFQTSIEKKYLKDLLPEPLQNFMGGVSEMFIPPGLTPRKALDTAIGLGADIKQNPLDILGWLPGGYVRPSGEATIPQQALGKVGKGLLAGQTAEAKKAAQAYSEGRYPQAVGYGAAAVAPLAGPLVSGIVERFGEGEPWRAAGNIAGLAFPLPVGKLGRMKPKIIPKSPVDLFRSEKTGGKLSGMLTGISEKSLAGAPVFKPKRARQQQQLINNVNEIIDEISSFRGGVEETGIRVLNAVERGKDRLLDAAGKLYTFIDEAVEPTIVRRPTTITQPSSMVGPKGEALTTTRRVLRKVEEGGVAVETAPLKRVVIPLLKRLKKQAEIMPSPLLKSSREQLEVILRAPKRIGFIAMQDTRSDLLKIGRRLDEVITGKQAALSKKIAHAADGSMEAALKGAERPDLLQILRAANAETKYAHELFDKTMLGKFVQRNPQGAHKLLITMPHGEIRQMRHLVGEKTFAEMKVRLLRDMLDDAIQGELSPRLAHQAESLGIPGAVGSAVGTGYQLLQPAGGAVLRGKGSKGLMTQLENLGNERLLNIFSKEEYSNLVRGAQLAEKVSGQAGGIASLVAAGLNWQLLGDIVRGGGQWLKGEGLGGFVDPATLSVAMWATAKVMSRTGGIKVMEKLSSAIEKKNVAQAMFWGQRFNNLITQASKGYPGEETPLPQAAPIPEPPPQELPPTENIPVN